MRGDNPCKPLAVAAPLAPIRHPAGDRCFLFGRTPLPEQLIVPGVRTPSLSSLSRLHHPSLPFVLFIQPTQCYLALQVLAPRLWAVPVPPLSPHFEDVTRDGTSLASSVYRVGASGDGPMSRREIERSDGGVIS
ncbi:hypothetical protein CSUB01_10485 [Colletotrichum sublineola]|uniref:Uncharacterized protein n=1 Tax=Colletotrichum sublineola TaxID=1173701 RepID=A0A066Y282_COLSU|nr:hypothetical protein CSUB01_10485 [Colletotrichum sublineola]